jgi:hypothetical protein
MATVSIVDTTQLLTGYRQHRQYRPGDQARGATSDGQERRVQTMLTVLTQKPPFSGLI